ncbi:SusC/RagA family TonB-linked outer membrane protein [Sphingobacterium composti]|uniref:SusC/RagA family TonB-linked outer membrane protein n=1 Tax=Sphingobacterium composti TaxID=363260 RepID=UPI0013599C12|nr:TonB-dependent receptor [Sphingobacterium composti Ten et al. 2007 non Yoo et al. 2007]
MKNKLRLYHSFIAKLNAARHGIITVLYYSNLAKYKSQRNRLQKSLYLTFLLLPILLLLLSAIPSQSQADNKKSFVKQEKIQVTGQVTDSLKNPIAGVSVKVKTGLETSTDQNGRYVIVIPKEIVNNAVLTFSSVGFQNLQVPVVDKAVIDVMLAESSQLIGETVVTAFGSKAKKEDVVASITTINPSELKIPSSNLTAALAGRAAGIIGFQRTGEPGADNADFFIRGVTTFGYKVDPLILIDNIESTPTDLARLQVDDIENFSILKDASAAAVYGARGANGVLLITTKEGKRENLNVSVRVENSLSTPTRQVELVDPITYMKLANEALLGRDPLTRSPYSMQQIEYTPEGGSLEYPAVDWQKELLNNYALNQRVNMSVKGGGSIAQYFVSGALNQDNGILKVPKVSNFNNNVNLKTYSMRSNVNINLTPITQLNVRLSGTFDDYNGPLQSATKAYRDIMRAVPTRFQPYYPPGENYKYLQHIMFGNADEGGYLNPYAQMVRGYREYNQSRMQAQLELNQKLDMVTDGLSATLRATTTRYAFYEVSRAYKPFYYKLEGLDDNNNYRYSIYNEDEGTEYLDYSQGGKDVTSIFFMQGLVNYQKKFGDHSFNGMLVGTMNSELNGNPGSLQLSLPHRNLNVAGRFTYGYLGRYNIEANFGYNGSERFSKEHRFGFFPSVGVAWHVSREKFFEPLNNIVSNFRLRGTYGLVGNDAIGSASQRFYYLSEVNMNSSARAWTFGPSLDESLNGVSVSRYPNREITWETAYKTNLAVELGLFNNKLEIQADFFKEDRKNIFMQRADIPSTMGLAAAIHANIGEAQGKGFDMSASYTKSFYNGLWIKGMANFTFATSKFIVYEEPYYNHPWLFRAGYPINIARGYIAERLFIDDEEVRNSPEQQLGGQVIAGDIKYVDVNGDGRITSLDMVPLGYPTVPEVNYGFGISLGHKKFDFSVFFQGLGRESFFIDPRATGPFRSYAYSGETLAGTVQNNVLQVYADDHWSVENRDVYALFPRLSWTSGNPNNEVTSSWWMRNGEFLRLKQLEMGLTFDKNGSKFLNRVNVGSLRLYANGLNLLTFSRFKLWDVEMAGNGLAYPIQRVFNLGVKLDF